MNNQPKALEAYSAYLQKKPGVLDAYIQELRGDIYAALDNYQSALDAYTAAIKASQPGGSIEIQMKTGQMYAAMGDDKNALRTYLAVYDATQSDFYKAQANLLAGQIYIKMGMADQAYARFQDSVNNYPHQYDSYSGLVDLVNNNVPVDELKRAVVDYYAGQYGYALEAFNRYIAGAAKPEAAAHYYKALTLIEMNQPQNSLAEWDILINNYTQQQWNLIDKDMIHDSHSSSAWDEKAYVQWAYLDQYAGGCPNPARFREPGSRRPLCPGRAVRSRAHPGTEQPARRRRPDLGDGDAEVSTVRLRIQLAAAGRSNLLPPGKIRPGADRFSTSAGAGSGSQPSNPRPTCGLARPRQR